MTDARNVESIYAHAAEVFSGISTPVQWNRLARMTSSVYALDMASITLLTEKMDTPPFLVMNSMEKASMTIPTDSEPVELLTPRIVQVRRSSSDIEAVIPRFIDLPEGQGSVGFMDADNVYHPRVSFPQSPSSSHTPHVSVSLDQGQKLAVQTPDAQALSSRVVPITSFTSNYRVDILRGEMVILHVFVKTPRLGVAHPYKALTPLYQGEVLPVQYATSGATIDTYWIVHNPFDLDVYLDTDTPSSVGIILRRQAHSMNVFDRQYYTDYLSTCVQELFTTAGFTVHVDASLLEPFHVVGSTVRMQPPNVATLTTIVEWLASQFMTRLVVDPVVADACTRFATLFTLTALDADTTEYVSKVSSHPVASLDEADLARRCMITLIRCLDPTLLSCGHGTAPVWPFSSKPVDVMPASFLTPAREVRV